MAEEAPTDGGGGAPASTYSVRVWAPDLSDKVVRFKSDEMVSSLRDAACRAFGLVSTSFPHFTVCEVVDDRMVMLDDDSAVEYHVNRWKTYERPPHPVIDRVGERPRGALARMFRRPKKGATDRIREKQVMSQPYTPDQGLRDVDLRCYLVLQQYLDHDPLRPKNDPLAERFHFLQCCSRVISGEYSTPKTDFLTLAGLQMQAEYGDYDQVQHTARMFAGGKLARYIPMTVARALGENAAADRIFHLQASYRGLSKVDAMRAYLKQIQDLPYYGGVVFDVKDCMALQKRALALMHDHLLVLTYPNKQVIDTVLYEDIELWMCSGGVFAYETVQDPDTHHVFACKEAAEIAVIVGAHVRRAVKELVKYKPTTEDIRREREAAVRAANAKLSEWEGGDGKGNPGTAQQQGSGSGSGSGSANAENKDGGRRSSSHGGSTGTSGFVDPFSMMEDDMEYLSSDDELSSGEAVPINTTTGTDTTQGTPTVYPRFVPAKDLKGRTNRPPSPPPMPNKGDLEHFSAVMANRSHLSQGGEGAAGSPAISVYEEFPREVTQKHLKDYHAEGRLRTLLESGVRPPLPPQTPVAASRQMDDDYPEVSPEISFVRDLDSTTVYRTETSYVREAQSLRQKHPQGSVRANRKAGTVTIDADKGGAMVVQESQLTQRTLAVLRELEHRRANVIQESEEETSKHRENVTAISNLRPTSRVEKRDQVARMEAAERSHARYQRLFRSRLDRLRLEEAVIREAILQELGETEERVNDTADDVDRTSTGRLITIPRIADGERPLFRYKTEETKALEADDVSFEQQKALEYRRKVEASEVDLVAFQDVAKLRAFILGEDGSAPPSSGDAATTPPVHWSSSAPAFRTPTGAGPDDSLVITVEPDTQLLGDAYGHDPDHVSPNTGSVYVRYPQHTSKAALGLHESYFAAEDEEYTDHSFWALNAKEERTAY